jgi:RNA polymerase sigma-32 factor
MVVNSPRLDTATDTGVPDAGSEDGDETYSPAAYLPAPDADPAVQIENAEWDDSTGDRLQAALKTLDARARDILVSRWTGDGKTTLHDLAEKYGVSAERIRQIEASAFTRRGLMVEPGSGRLQIAGGPNEGSQLPQPRQPGLFYAGVD